MLSSLRRARADVALMGTVLPAAERLAHEDGIPEPGDASGPLRTQGALQVAFARAVSLAKADGLPVSSGHLLLAVIEPDHGTVARALTRLGIDRASLTRETRSLLGSS